VAQGVLYTLVDYLQHPKDTLVITTIVSVVVPAAFYTAVITPFVFIALDWVFGERKQPQGSVT